jgi:hypothetical protein
MSVYRALKRYGIQTRDREEGLQLARRRMRTRMADRDDSDIAYKLTPSELDDLLDDLSRVG